MIKFWWWSESRIRILTDRDTDPDPDNWIRIQIQIRIAKLVRHVLVEVCTVPVLLVKQVVIIILHKASSPLHMDGSVVFARWRQCALISNTWFLDPPDSASQTASQSVQPFLHSSRQRPESPYTLQWATPFPPQNCPFPLWDLDPIKYVFQPFLQGSRSWPTDRQTDHATSSATIAHIFVVLQCSLKASMSILGLQEQFTLCWCYSVAVILLFHWSSTGLYWAEIFL